MTLPTAPREVELYESADGWHVQYVTTEGGDRAILDWAPGVPDAPVFAHRRSARKAARRDHPLAPIVDVDE